MSVTVNVNNMSLCHKGSNGIATATIPDVCKTPSPGGPIPIPYPNIAQSSDLSDGSESVKADGGNSIAVKGSKFSKSNGDEAGTAGGVKSSVNMKEATWILYSFDVKIEGKNVCRLTDKMFMNKENTACLGGEIQGPVATGVIVLECESGWSDCQKKQMKAKADKMDQLAKQKGGLPARSTAGRIRKAANTWAAKFARDWDKASPEGWPASADPSKQKDKFYHDCAKTDDPLGDGMQADHVQEVQLGGKVHGPFLWLDGEVNGASGRQIKQARDKGCTNPSGFTTKNCD